MSNSPRLPDIFPPHIADRGRHYFEHGKVQGIRETAAGRYQATVRGSARYSVWLKLDKGLRIQSGGCDCPYDDVCKHMAALWYALRAQLETQGVPQFLADWLARADEAALREMLMKLAEDETVRERLTALLQPEKRKEIYQQQIRQMFARAGHDYYDAMDLGVEVQDWLGVVAQDGDAAVADALPLLMPRLIRAYEKMDDSGGILADAIDSAVELLDRATRENAPESLIRCLDKCLKDDRYFEYGDSGYKLYHIRARIWQQNGQWKAWQKYVDSRLAKADGWDSKFWAMARWQLFQAQGDTAGAQDWFERHLYLPEFRKIAVAQAVGQQNWAEAERLLREGMALAGAKGHLGTLHDWKLQLFAVMQQTGADIRALAEDLAFHKDDFSLPHYQAWKATFSEAEWPAEFERLLARLAKSTWLSAEILQHEQKFDLLLSVLKQYAGLSLATLDHFSPSFPEPYHAQIVDCYLTVFDREISKANNRKQYRQLAKQLKMLGKHYPDQQQAVSVFAAEIKARNNTKLYRRPALLEEWERVGF